MRAINFSDLDRNLLADIEGASDGFLAFEADMPGATTDNQAYQIVYNDESGRGGIVLVGSGGSGITTWTDAASADDVLARYLADDILN